MSLACTSTSGDFFRSHSASEATSGKKDTTSCTDQISFGFSGLSSTSLVVQNSYFDQDTNHTNNTNCPSLP